MLGNSIAGNTHIPVMARWIAILIFAISGSSGNAQSIESKSMIIGRDAANPFPTSPAQAVFNVRVLESRLESMFPSSAPQYPQDSIREVILARATEWFNRLKSSVIAPIQLDNMA